jgi:GrpB-like predicted nucleotidyltransferase (UPF0157 family)
MITAEQQIWLNHLSNEDKVLIIPYDVKSPQKFKAIERKIKETLGEKTVVLHRGASSMGISGQGELDIYVPVDEKAFKSKLKPLKNLFGKPGTVYPLERARFVTHIDGTKAEVFLINKNSQGWLDGLKFEKYLKRHPDALMDYRDLKEKNDGLSTKAYYTEKIAFINKILSKT